MIINIDNTKIFNADKQKAIEMDYILQQIKNKLSHSKSISWQFLIMDNGKLQFQESVTNKLGLNQLKEMGVIKISERSAEEVNKKLKEVKGIIVESLIIKPIEPKFSQVCREYKEKTNGNIEENKKKETKTIENSLKSIHLITSNLIGNRLDIVNTIFLVLDEYFEKPIRCAIKNKKGEPASIKNLYDIAYFVNVPGKKTDYSKRMADNINNGLFKKRMVAIYMKTNKLKKPTLVQKSEDGNYLVLKNEILVKTGIIGNDVPAQYKSLYIDKTK